MLPMKGKLSNVQALVILKTERLLHTYNWKSACRLSVQNRMHMAVWVVSNCVESVKLPGFKNSASDVIFYGVFFYVMILIRK